MKNIKSFHSFDLVKESDEGTNEKLFKVTFEFKEAPVYYVNAKNKRLAAQAAHDLLKSRTSLKHYQVQVDEASERPK